MTEEAENFLLARAHSKHELRHGKRVKRPRVTKLLRAANLISLWSFARMTDAVVQIDVRDE
ncbi:hypothetical protein CBOM_07383 [Ceraceosorus bombacis]|uniref:Uncharacterized protein n=1 Tax=Ceraceosorus bombacis TaxID=401625 RepID=A0A0P1BC64_9BASI|nr:hypothetical protein CBOM_07383 [Ceraceosorus bombacis]